MIQPITLNQEIQIFEKDFKKIHDEHFISVDEILKPQPVAISIGYSDYKGNLYPISMGSYGDFSCIVGASKAKKSFLKSMFIAGYIGGSSNLYFDNIKGHRDTEKYVIDIDTEQSEYHSQRVFKRVVELVGGNPSFYKPFALRKLSANERFEFIEWLFTKSPYVGNIGLVSIDGVADLVNDVNDLEASNKVAQKLLEWSAVEKCHIITVLHRNFGTAKPTGHLGSAVLKKAETVIFVEKQNDLTIVNPEYTRNQPFEPFAFYVGSDYLPRLCDYTKSDKVINKKAEQKF
jgi:hypothetical protein